MTEAAPEPSTGTPVKEVALALKVRLKRHNSVVYAAAVAFFAFLALIPALIAVIGIYGLAADPADIVDRLNDALAGAPESTRGFIVDQMSAIAAGSRGALGLSVVLGTLLALFSASGAVANLIKSLNVAYELEETRKPWVLRGLAIVFFVGAIVVLGIDTLVTTVLPEVLADLEYGSVVRWILNVASYPLLAILMAGALSLLYRIGPDHRGNDRPLSPKLLTIGGVTATFLFVVLSAAFSFYTANFASYGETYGPLATIIVLLLWFQLSALAVIVGAEIDAELADRAWHRRTGLEDPTRSGDAVDAGRSLYEALGHRDVAGVLAHWHRRGVQHDPLFGELAVPDQLRAYLEEMMAALPDLDLEVREVTGDENTATVRYRLTGSFSGVAWGGMPPNGRALEIDAASFLTLEDGFVVRNDVVYDTAAVVSQLGFRPGSEGAGDRFRAGVATFRQRWRERRRS